MARDRAERDDGSDDENRRGRCTKRNPHVNLQWRWRPGRGWWLCCCHRSRSRTECEQEGCRASTRGSDRRSLAQRVGGRCAETIGLCTHTQTVHNHAWGPGWRASQPRRVTSRLAAATMFSGVKPNFFCSSLSGADAPNVSIPSATPAAPTYRAQPSVDPVFDRHACRHRRRAGPARDTRDARGSSARTAPTTACSPRAS